MRPLMIPKDFLARCSVLLGPNADDTLTMEYIPLVGSDAAVRLEALDQAKAHGQKAWLEEMAKFLAKQVRATNITRPDGTLLRTGSVEDWQAVELPAVELIFGIIRNGRRDPAQAELPKNSPDGSATN
jgi:hypothetical protein